MNRGASKLFFPVVLVVSAILIVVIQFGFIFLLLSMLPSLVARFMDEDADKPIFKIVCACNAAATLPYLVPMLQAGLRLRHYDVSGIMADPSVWMLVLLGAACGWCLIFLCRFIARFIITITYEYSIASLEAQQKQLAEEWGDQIRQPPAA